MLDHIEEMTPIVYTPVVALGVSSQSHLSPASRLFVCYELRDSIPMLLRNRPNRDIDVHCPSRTGSASSGSETKGWGTRYSDWQAVAIYADWRHPSRSARCDRFWT